MNALQTLNASALVINMLNTAKITKPNPPIRFHITIEAIKNGIVVNYGQAGLIGYENNYFCQTLKEAEVYIATVVLPILTKEGK